MPFHWTQSSSVARPRAIAVVDPPFVVMALSPDLACWELKPLMELVGLPIRNPYVVRGLEDLAVRQQAIVAPLKISAVAAASLVPAKIPRIVQGLLATYGLILLSGQVQIQPSTAFPHVCTSCRL